MERSGAAPGNEQIRLRRALVRPEDGAAADPIDVATAFRIEFEYWNLRESVRLNLSLHVYDTKGFWSSTRCPVTERDVVRTAAVRVGASATSATFPATC